MTVSAHSFVVCAVVAARFDFVSRATATSQIYTLSLHDALPISAHPHAGVAGVDHDDGVVGNVLGELMADALGPDRHRDRKSTRLNSSHSQISYAVFCLKKKKSGRVVRWALTGPITATIILSVLK